MGWLVQLLQQLSKVQPHMGSTCAQPDTAGTGTFTLGLLRDPNEIHIRKDTEPREWCELEALG